MSTSKLGLVLPELSYKVVGVCMGVHSELGSKLLEKNYQRVVEKGLGDVGLEFEREVSVKISYKNRSIGRYFLDFVVERKIVLELKAQRSDGSKFYRQVLAYLRQLDLPLGIVVNFRESSIKPDRIVNSKWPGLRIRNN